MVLTIPYLTARNGEGRSLLEARNGQDRSLQVSVPAA